MGKKLCAVALAVMLITIAVGCNDNSSKYPWSITKSDMNIEYENEKIIFQLVDDTLTAKGAKFTLYNNDNDISFGPEYLIQIFRNNAWYEIEISDEDWTGELMTIEANHEYTFEIDWYSTYGELPTGRYRILKEYKRENQVEIMVLEFELP